MKKNYEDIYIYNGDNLMGQVRIYENLSKLNVFRIYMDLNNYKIVKDNGYGY